MKILEITLNGIGIFIAGAGFIVGILSWWIAKLLDDKKKITEHEIKIEDVEDDIRDIKDRMKAAKI